MSINTRRTRVLAFLRAWSPALAGRELEAIRAHLRGLGAELVIAAEAGAWWLGPDDELRPALPHELAPVTGRAPRRDVVIVLDSAGSVRFAHEVDGPLEDSLAEALAFAGEALLAQPAPPVELREPAEPNRFEVELAKRTRVRALAELGGVR